MNSLFLACVCKLIMIPESFAKMDLHDYVFIAVGFELDYFLKNNHLQITVFVIVI